MKIFCAFLLIAVVFFQCSPSDGLMNVTPGDDTSTEHPVISHFYDLVSVKRDGLDSWYEPRSQKGTIKVYIHVSVPEEDRLIISNFLSEIKELIRNESIQFEIINEIEGYNIGIVKGGPLLFNEVFKNDRSFPPSYLGAATYTRNNQDCAQIEKAELWYTEGETLLKHEILHTLGFFHADYADKNGSIMYHNITDMEPDMTENDKSVLRLLYYNGVYGSIVDTVTDCDEDAMYMDAVESEAFKLLLQSIIDNDYL